MIGHKHTMEDVSDIRNKVRKNVGRYGRRIDRWAFLDRIDKPPIPKWGEAYVERLCKRLEEFPDTLYGEFRPEVLGSLTYMLDILDRSRIAVAIGGMAAIGAAGAAIGHRECIPTEVADRVLQSLPRLDELEEKAIRVAVHGNGEGLLYNIAFPQIGSVPYSGFLSNGKRLERDLREAYRMYKQLNPKA